METNLKDSPEFPPALLVCGRAFADLVSSRLMDIQDPETGESPRIELETVQDGIRFLIRGSDHCRAEAEIRILAMTKSDFVSASGTIDRLSQQLRS